MQTMPHCSDTQEPIQTARSCKMTSTGSGDGRVKWEMRLNTDKMSCRGNGEIKSNETKIDVEIGKRCYSEGRPESRINRTFAETYETVKNVRFAFHYMHTNTTGKLITAVIRPELEYAEAVRSPSYKEALTKTWPSTKNGRWFGTCGEIEGNGFTTTSQQREKGKI